MSINRVRLNDRNEPMLGEDESILFKESAVVQFDVERHAKFSGTKRVTLVITSKQWIFVNADPNDALRTFAQKSPTPKYVAAKLVGISYLTSTVLALMPDDVKELMCYVKWKLYAEKTSKNEEFLAAVKRMELGIVDVVEHGRRLEPVVDMDDPTDENYQET